MNETREGTKRYEETDLASYSNQTFGMFAGEEEIVTLQCANRLIGVVLDRFGKEVDVRPMKRDCFQVRAKIAVSGQFFGWLAGIGKEIKIVTPQKIVINYKEWLKSILEQASIE